MTALPTPAPGAGTLARLHARVSCPLPLTAQAEGQGGYGIANLSVGGALLVGDPLLDVGSTFRVDIVANAADVVTLQARVVRHQPHADRSAMAVTFLEVPPEVEGRIGRMVMEGFKSLGARILGQVRTEMARQGITDVAVVAEELHRIKEEQARAHLFASDLFTEQGSNATATIISATTGARRECIVWSLNLYLGLNRHPHVIARTREAVERFGTGCGTSAPSCGLSSLHNQIERRVAEMVGKPKALVFSTGFAANLGALSSLPGPKDLVLLDREDHASIIDGVKMSGRKWMAFRHNDVADLEDKLLRFGPNHENIFVVVESAYSMSGDLAPLKEMVALKKKYRFFLYVDEAHTFGFYGEGGRGYCYEQGVSDQVDFIMSTFSKATASIGGFVACDARYVTLMQATSTPYIFQACLSPSDAAAILASLDQIQGDPSHARTLHENNRYMREQLVKEGFNLGHSQSPVIPVYVPDLEQLYRLCASLYLDGIFSVPIVYPAVGVNEGRIRFIVNAHHTREQIDRTVASLASHARTLGVIRPRG